MLRGHLEAIQEEESEGEDILPVVDPDWPTDPLESEPIKPTRPTLEEQKDEAGNWSLTMFGVAFVFLAIASYMD